MGTFFERYCIYMHMYCMYIVHVSKKLDFEVAHTYTYMYMYVAIIYLYIVVYSTQK